MDGLKYFVDAEWLKEHLGDADVFVLDTRFDLFDPENYGRNGYAKAHIPGAFYFDMDADITENKGEHGGRRGTPDPNVLGAKLAAIGVGMDSTIVCYDDGVYASPRVWWQLRYMGYDKVFVLDGGFNNWKAKGYPTSDSVPGSRGQGQFVATIRTGMIACKKCVEAAMKDPATHMIVDSRAANRYSGEYEPLYSKKGHIPGAVNIHYLRNMKEAESLDFIGNKAQWEENFAACLGKEDTILYCGSAIEAAINFMFMSELDYEPRLYVGSMSDWVSYDDTEVENSLV